MLIKYTGKYVKKNFIMKITFRDGSVMWRGWIMNDC